MANKEDLTNRVLKGEDLKRGRQRLQALPRGRLSPFIRSNILVMSFARKDVYEFAIDAINKAIRVVDSTTPESAEVAL